VGNNPQAVTYDDFNKDGIFDLAVANSSTDNVSILMGTVTGSFAAAQNFLAGSSPWNVGSSDFNGDGNADLVVVNYTGFNVSVLMGDGTGNFAAPVNYTVGGNATAVTCADFNTDGKIDLAVSNWYSNSISLLLGNGNGTFAPKTDFPVTTNPWFINHADFNRDGNLDLVTTNMTSNNMAILLGNGVGGFGTAVYIATGNIPRSVDCADFNIDGKTDLVVANDGSNNVSLFYGNGNGTFGAATNYSTGLQPWSVVSADFDMNGKLDLAVTNRASNNVSTLLTITAQPVVDAGTDQSVCDNASVILTGSGASSFFWNQGVIDGVPFFPSLGSKTYKVTGYDANGCSGTDSLVVSVHPDYLFNDNASICNGESYSWHGSLYQTAGTYYDSLVTIQGCDSVFVLDLSVSLVDVTLTVQDPVITANATGATYQWLDCNNGYAIIPGQTEQTFTATSNGNYAVAVTQAVCTDTSQCVQIVSIGMSEGNSTRFSVYPNPVVEFLTIRSMHKETDLLRIEVLDLIGKTLFASRFIDQVSIPMTSFPAGMYLLKIDYGAGFEVSKVIKKQ
jgi:hypothetical protein